MISEYIKSYNDIFIYFFLCKFNFLIFWRVSFKLRQNKKNVELNITAFIHSQVYLSLFLQTSSKIVFQRILSKICPIKLFLFHLGQFISRMNCSNAIIFVGLCFFFLNCFHYSIHFHFVAFLSNFVSSASSFHVVLSGTGMCLFISRFCDRGRNCWLCFFLKNGPRIGQRRKFRG